VGSDWIVLSGLTAGDRVVVDNLLKVRPGAMVTQNATAPAAAAPESKAAADKSAPPAK
jgi:membrane fusion protein (multidrug efflux system)